MARFMTLRTAGSASAGSASGAGGLYAWVIAVALCFVAAIISNLGLNFQKLALTRRAAGGAARGYQSLWAAGALSGAALAW